MSNFFNDETENKDYSKSVIYILKCKNEEIPEIYVGSTENSDNRFIQHKKNCNYTSRPHYNYKVYRFIRANGGIDNWEMDIIEEYPCENNLQLRIRERYWYDLMTPELNSSKPYVSREERKIIDREYSKKYRTKHKEYAKEYREKAGKYNCKCGSIVANLTASIKRHNNCGKHLNWLAIQEWIDSVSNQTE
jgi:hypothetical protein